MAGPPAADGDFFGFLSTSEAGRVLSHASSSKIPGRGVAPIVWPVGITALVGIIVLFFLAVEGGHALAKDSNAWRLDESFGGIFAVIDCLLLAACVAVIWGLRTACPKCKGLWARQVARTKHLGSELEGLRLFHAVDLRLPKACSGCPWFWIIGRWIVSLRPRLALRQRPFARRTERQLYLHFGFSVRSRAAQSRWRIDQFRRD